MALSRKECHKILSLCQSSPALSGDSIISSALHKKNGPAAHDRLKELARYKKYPAKDRYLLNKNTPGILTAADAAHDTLQAFDALRQTDD